MYVCYSFVLFVALCFYFPFYYVKLRLLRGERLHFKERLGFGLPSVNRSEKSCWIHAVSVGEVLSLTNLIARLKERNPDWTIHFSSLTHSGFHVAKSKLSGVDNFFFIPLDFKCIVNRFFKKLQPDLFILAESELWPNLLRVSKKYAHTTLLVNGRISQRSARRYRKLKFLVKRLLKNVDIFLVQTEREREILVQMDVDHHKIEVGGNLKAEVELPSFSDSELNSFRDEMRIKRTDYVVVAGSTHRGEEDPLLSTLVEARKESEKILLILAPRHLDRVDEVDKLCIKHGLRCERRSTVGAGNPWDVLILDTMGELAHFYALSDAAFIGGSLIPWGGQNLLEPAFYGKPIYFGSSMENFALLAQEFIESGAAKMIHDQNEIIQLFLPQDRDALYRMGLKAKKTLESLGGATDKTIKALEKAMDS
ncbi:3-deoxy-D-manno-octulosonic acid transferase [Acidobacteriota bacterium]